MSEPAIDDWILTLWVIYDRPRDLPASHRYWVRAQHVFRDERIVFGQPAYGFAKLENARGWCEQQGLTCLPRSESDDPVIVESWI